MDREPKIITTLIIGGGGTKGVTKLGALHYLISNNILNLKTVKYYAGTSVGVIIIILLEMGYTPIEILKELYYVDLSSIKVSDFGNILKTFGFLDFKPYIQTFKELLLKKIPNKILTLSELAFKTGHRYLFTSTNISKQTKVYITEKNYPDLLLTDLIGMCCSVPIIFKPFLFDKDLFVDGGLHDNFPIEHSIELWGCTLTNILGIMTYNTDSLVVDNILKYLYTLLALPSSVKNNNEYLGALIIKIEFNSDGVGVDIIASDDSKNSLFSKGYAAASIIATKKIVTLFKPSLRLKVLDADVDENSEWKDF